MIEKASILNLLNAAVLMYGGITDFKRREIPNIVPICLLATGLISWDHIPVRIACMLLMALVLWLACIACSVFAIATFDDFKFLFSVTKCSLIITEARISKRKVSKQ